MMESGIKEDAIEAAYDVAGDAIGALEREAARRRADACQEVAKFSSRMARLRHGRRVPFRRLRLALTGYRLGLALDRCAALHAEK